MHRVGQNHIHTVYVRSVWQGNYQISVRIWCIYTVLANAMYVHTCVRRPAPAFQSIPVSCYTPTPRQQGEVNTSGVSDQQPGKCCSCVSCYTLTPCQQEASKHKRSFKSAAWEMLLLCEQLRCNTMPARGK
jgi:hypothetical protein